MCSLLIFNVANVHPDPTQQWTKFVAGDVIDIQDDDNFYWGDDIQGDNPLGLWTVVSIPGVAAADLISLAMGETTPNPPAPYLLRTQTVDVASLQSASQPVQKKGSRNNSDPSGPQPDITTDQVTLMSFVSQKPPLVNQSVIGTPSQTPVIG